MVAGKVKVAMGFQKSPATPKLELSPKPPLLPSPSSANKSHHNSTHQKANFSRSFGVYFPRASAQVQPRPPDVAELLKLVEQLRERESRLKTELLEQKLMEEAVAILPMLENKIAEKDGEIENAMRRIDDLEAENKKLLRDFEAMEMKLDEERRNSQAKVKDLEAEIAKMATTSNNFTRDHHEHEEISLSHRFQGLIDVSVKSNLIRNLKKSVKSMENQKSSEGHNCSGSSSSVVEMKQQKDGDESSEIERLMMMNSSSSRCSSSNSSICDDVAEPSYFTLSSSCTRSRAPRVPKPPPKPSLNTSLSLSLTIPSSPLISPSSSPSSSCSDDNTAVNGSKAPIPPPPPPPPPAVKFFPKSLKSAPPPPPPPLPPTKSSRMPPPPPPPPLPTKGSRLVPARVRRVPEVVEFYHSLMRRDSRRDSGSGTTDVLAATNARDMIGEIENRSTHLLAIKTDVETQGDFIRFLIKEVENAAFNDIEDVVPFVKWLDDELSYLVDERAVLKHFEWPEKKADALREAAFGYCDFKKLETEASSFRDVARQPCSHALKKMQALFEKLEHGVYNLSRMRESAAKRYKLFKIPMDWMLETGFVNQIKLASVKLALKYMKRVSAELEMVDGGFEEEDLIVQGVRFAFRVHQFAGGFDVETMKAFEELRDKAKACHIQCQNQPQKLLCRSTSTTTTRLANL